MNPKDIGTITAESATISLHGVKLTPDLTIDEMTLESEDLALTPGLAGVRYTGGEIRFRGMLTEANVNRIISAGIPADAPLRHVKITLYTGRAQLKGQYVKSVMSLPFTMEVRPALTNGIRLSLDCSATQVGGIGLPGPAVDIIERIMNEKLTIDLTRAAFPVRLDEVRCEPGRLTIIGKAKFSWPPAGTVSGIEAQSEPAVVGSA